MNVVINRAIFLIVLALSVVVLVGCGTGEDGDLAVQDVEPTQTPSLSPTVTASPAATSTLTPALTPRPSATTVVVVITETATPTVPATSTPTYTPTATVTHTPSATPTPTPWKVFTIVDNATLSYADAPWEKIEDGEGVPGLYLRLEDDLENLGDFVELVEDGTFVLEEANEEFSGTWTIVGSDKIHLFQ